MEELESAEKAIKECIKRNTADLTPVVRRFQENLERRENTLISSLEDKREKKLLQLTPNTRLFSHTPSRTHSFTHTHPSPNTTGGEHQERENSLPMAKRKALE